MRVISYIPLHYGAEYLDCCIRALDPVSEKILILYTDQPSHGTGTSDTCPESESQLKEIAYNASSKIDWVKIKAGFEGQHRNMAFAHADGYDMLATADADEVWDSISLEYALKNAHDDKTHRRFRIDGFINFWKSFNEVCYDWFHPVRIFNLKNQDGETDLQARIWHFGCAQAEHIMRYKLKIHGHVSEIRHRWLEDIYLSDHKIDLHPVSKDLWNAVPFDKMVLPEMLQKHPNFNKQRI